MLKHSKLALRMCLCVTALTAAPFAPAVLHGSAALAGAASSEKDAFNAAKELGTVEAWDAFLSNYPSGFHADLARAYVKKLAEQAPASAPSPDDYAPAKDEFPTEAGSWGGIVRSGPGQSYPKQDSLSEGDPVSLMGRGGELDNGYPWFKIWYGPNQKKGYMWGGILCAKRVERSDVYQMCPAGSKSTSTSGSTSDTSSGSYCQTPSNDAERIICANNNLSALDAELNAEYSTAVSNITSDAVGGTAADVANFRQEQRDWLRKRNDCGGNISCIAAAYRSRLEVLREQNQPE